VVEDACAGRARAAGWVRASVEGVRGGWLAESIEGGCSPRRRAPMWIGWPERRRSQSRRMTSGSRGTWGSGREGGVQVARRCDAAELDGSWGQTRGSGGELGGSSGGGRLKIFSCRHGGNG
jgi:hypothetical protein